MATNKAAEIEIIAAEHRRSLENKRWTVVLAVEDVPPGYGHYALYDGIQMRRAGVTGDMRKAIGDASWYGKLEMPIYMFLPDTDGSAELWLDGKIRCVCGDVMNIEKHEKHLRVFRCKPAPPAAERPSHD